jgi:hypothetical protein
MPTRGNVVSFVETTGKDTMSTSPETIASHNADDVYATITLDTQGGSLRFSISGPESSIGLDVSLGPEGRDTPHAVEVIDRRLRAWSDAIDALRLAIADGSVHDHLYAPAD